MRRIARFAFVLAHRCARFMRERRDELRIRFREPLDMHRAERLRE